MRNLKTRRVRPIPWERRIVLIVGDERPKVILRKSVPKGFDCCGLGQDPMLPDGVDITVATPLQLMRPDDVLWNYTNKAKAVTALLDYEKRSTSRRVQAETNLKPFDDWEP